MKPSLKEFFSVSSGPVHPNIFLTSSECFLLLHYTELIILAVGL